MLIVLLLLGIAIVWAVRSIWTASCITVIDSKAMKGTLDIPATIKMLDVRDSIDFQESHVRDSINIPIGRLPYVWSKELSPDDPVLILADSRYKSNKAARILRRQGFHRLYAVRGEFGTYQAAGLHTWENKKEG